MYRHLMVGTDDPEKARVLYDALFATLGIGPGTMTPAKDRVIYRAEQGMFIVGKPIDGEAASHANGGTIGFTAPSVEAVEAWHKAGLENGATSCEDPPGPRVSPSTGKGVYLAYLRDHAGNKMCAVFDMD